MGRLFLLLLVALGAGFYFPESRAILVERLQPALNPGYRWASGGEMKQIVRDLQEWERVGRGLPVGRGEFEPWLRNRYQMLESTMDSWGTTYRLEVRGRVVRVISAGPDRTFGDRRRHGGDGSCPERRAVEVAVGVAPGANGGADAQILGWVEAWGPGSWLSCSGDASLQDSDSLRSVLIARRCLASEGL